MRLIWINMINAFIDLHTGGKARPVSFDIMTTYPSLDELTRSAAAIRREVEEILPFKDAIPRYHEVDTNQRYISSQIDPDRAWRTFMFSSVMRRNATNSARCPVTDGLLAKVPHVVNAFFSILEPGKSIPAHNGAYRGILRYHLALVVPKIDPPHMRVKDEIHQWTEGVPYLFDDSWEHEVTNHSQGVRVVLILDVLRPLPLLPHLLNAAAIWWMGRSDLYKRVSDAIETASRKMPATVGTLPKS
ncbi:aspartyl/asparaginyl beta-hydroxylase domain-containing protein [soil metagenome]